MENNDNNISVTPMVDERTCCVCMQAAQDPTWECQQCHTRCHMHCILQWVLRTLLTQNDSRIFTCPVCRLSQNISVLQRQHLPEGLATAGIQATVEDDDDEDDEDFEEEEEMSATTPRSLVVIKARQVSLVVHSLRFHNRS